MSKRAKAALRYKSIKFSELEALSNRYANALTTTGIARGMRTLLMVRQGVDFIALVFALFKIGAVPVLIDPGMGIARLLDCIRTVNLDAFIGVPIAHAVRVLRPAPFRTVRHAVTVGRRWFWSAPTLTNLAGSASDHFNVAPTTADETAAILFTSGSTGPAKGVVYEHGMFDAQVRMIQSTYNIEPGEIDLPTFPLFALFSVAMGMTIVLPDMDPSHPARVNPANIVDAVRDQKVSNTFGSPALWKRVAAYCVERSITLPTLRRILIAGAPVPPSVIEQLHQVLAAKADVHTPYGATESLPVSTIAGCEVVGWAVPTEASRTLPAKTEPRPSGSGRKEQEVRDCTHFQLSRSPANRKCNPGAPETGGQIDNQKSKIDNSPPTVSYTLLGAGTCVGRPVERANVRIIPITDDPIPTWSDTLLAPPDQVGEICVTGPAVTREYFNLHRANAISKIKVGATIWHRIGDLGYFDEMSRLWFCGRKAHRVQTQEGTLFTECIEPIFNQHPAVARCALVGVGAPGVQLPVLIIEPKPGHPLRGQRVRALALDILALAPSPSQGEGRGEGKAPQPPAHRAEIMNSSFGFGAQATGGPARPLAIANQQLALFQSQISNLKSTILFHRSLPVDIRHNAKINRELLAAWATRRFGD